MGSAAAWSSATGRIAASALPLSTVAAAAISAPAAPAATAMTLPSNIARSEQQQKHSSCSRI